MVLIIELHTVKLILPFLMELHLVMMEQKCILMMDLKIQPKCIQVNLSTPYDPSSGTFAFTLNTEDIPDLTANRFTMDIAFDDDGTRFYISEGINNGTGYATFMYVYKLSDPFELKHKFCNLRR